MGYYSWHKLLVLMKDGSAKVGLEDNVRFVFIPTDSSNCIFNRQGLEG